MIVDVIYGTPAIAAVLVLVNLPVPQGGLAQRDLRIALHSGSGWRASRRFRN